MPVAPLVGEYLGLMLPHGLRLAANDMGLLIRSIPPYLDRVTARATAGDVLHSDEIIIRGLNNGGLMVGCKVGSSSH